MRIVRLFDFAYEMKLFGVVYLRLKRKKGWVGYSLHRKRHCNAFFYIHSGSVEFKDKSGRLTTCTKDNMMFIPKDYECTSVYTAELTDISVINFRLQDGGEEATFGDCLEVMPKEYTARYKRYFLAFEERPRNINLSLFNTHCLCVLLAELNTENYEVEDDSRFALIQKGVEVLIDRFRENVPISEIARYSMISESYFRRIFREYYGHTPIEFRNIMRVSHADKLYASGLYTKGEAARAAGIEDANYYSRLKKKMNEQGKKREEELGID